MVYKPAKKALIAGLVLCASSVAFAADKPALLSGASASMLANTCAGCHGTNGASSGPASPTIAGMSEIYFTDMMTGYASGDIPSTIMGRIAKGYDEKDIANMAGFFSKQKFVPAKQAFDADLAKKGAKIHEKSCEKCHSEGGTLAEDDSGILAGQWENYLTVNMADFIAGHRTPSKKMKKKVEKMVAKEGDAGVAALIQYYASQQ